MVRFFMLIKLKMYVSLDVCVCYIFYVFNVLASKQSKMHSNTMNGLKMKLEPTTLIVNSP